MDSHSDSTDTTSFLQASLIDPPDLTNTLQQDSKRYAGVGSFGIVYRCLCARNGVVAVKAIAFLRSFDPIEKEVFLRKMSRELGLWKRLRHPNIVPFLGTARGEDFASDYPCIVSMWMPHGTLAEYVRERENELSLPSRIRLITGSAAGLEFLHSKSVIHMDFHPGNILIDSEHNPRLTDFVLSQTLSPERDQWSDLWTSSIRAGAMLWAAPEVLYPELYPALEIGATLDSDIYSLGSVILFILSGKFPWKNSAEVKDKSREFQNPPRPAWPANIPDGVWNFIEQCWSPRQPRNRPSAQEVLEFSRDKLEQLFQPNPASDVNVVVFGASGCGKSSIINLLAEEPVAQVSTDVGPCTKRPQCYQISIGERRLRLWDTMGFGPAHGGDTSHLLPYEQAHTVLRNLADDVNLILLCSHKDEISASLGSLYRLINDFFYGGRAPIAFVLTHCDTPDEQWWKRNQHIINRRTGIPVQSIPHVCVTTTQAGRDQSKQSLEALLRTFAASIAPTPARLDHLSHAAASRDLTAHFGLSPSDAKVLVERFSIYQEDAGKSRPLAPKTNSEDGDDDLLEKYVHKEQQPDEQPSTLSGHDNKPSTPENPGKISPSQPATVAHSEEGSGDRLEAEVSPSTPDSEFNYNDSLSSSHSSAAPRSLSCDEPLSPATSGQPQEDEILSGPSHAPPMTSTPEACALENLDTARSSHRHPIFKRLLQRMSNKDPTSHKPNRLSGESCELADYRSPLRARVSDRHKEPSRMAAARSKITKQPRARSPTETTIPAHPNASRNVQGAADRKGAGHAQQVNDDSQTSGGAIHVTDQRGSGYSVISIRLPSWMLCRASVAEDETHVTGQDRNAVGMQGQSGT